MAMAQATPDSANLTAIIKPTMGHVVAEQSQVPCIINYLLSMLHVIIAITVIHLFIYCLVSLTVWV
eukprot:m.138852 g.138852  ORF g.138852 m.138852 type:complete len:66 (-) comp14014_c0_seq8:1024-1221(-)